MLVTTVVLYLGDLRLGFFAVDDPQYVVDNPWIRGISVENLRHILTSPYFANYSPLHLLSYMLDYILAGPNPFVFHLSSNLWAGLVAGLVFLVALALTRHRTVAIAAGMLFILHPAHVEAIAWVSSRKDLVAAAFALPSLLAYLRYREDKLKAKWWYIASLALFVIALAGKMSVATFPMVFLAHDLFVEKRPLSRSLWDKVPFILSAGLMTLGVTSAQPSMGNRPNPYILAVALVQNFWLLSGFGSYVIYRVAPNAAAGIALELGAVLFLLAAFAAPLLLRRRAPMVAVLLYWLLFAMIPSQVLSFSHPVTDRYLFFPSVAAVILICWGVFEISKLMDRRDLIAAAVILVTIGVLWGRATLAYVGEWRDPRSVWYAATFKSSDPKVSENLGSYYLGMADRLGANPRPSPLADEEARRLASVVWAGDPRLPNLLSEWSAGKHGQPVEKDFQDALRERAWQAFERSLSVKGTHVMPGLYYNRGLILFSRDDLQAARKEFLAALDEASRETFAPVRQQLTVYCHTQLGAISVREGDYREALRWYRLAEDEQTRFGGNWVPDLSSNRRKVEAMVPSSNR